MGIVRNSDTVENVLPQGHNLLYIPINFVKKFVCSRSHDNLISIGLYLTTCMQNLAIWTPSDHCSICAQKISLIGNK